MSIVQIVVKIITYVYIYIYTQNIAADKVII